MDISRETSDGICLITMSEPGGLNVFTREAHQRLGACLTEADADDGVRVVILRGTDRSFSAGADLNAFPAPPCDPTAFVAEFLQANSLPERLRKPVLAVVHGSATAGGFELALACDWIFAAPQATFSLPEARFDLVAGYVAARLAPVIGTHRTRRLLMTGETLTAAQAVELGIPVTVGPDPLAAAREMAAQIRRSAPQAVALIKQRSVALAKALDPDFGVSISAYVALWNLPDTQEAIAAWREHRSPLFRPLSDPWG